MTPTVTVRWLTTQQPIRRKADFAVFQAEMKSLYESYSGERGIFNREGHPEEDRGPRTP